MVWIGLMIGFYIFIRMMEIQERQDTSKKLFVAANVTKAVVAVSLLILFITWLFPSI